MSIECVMAHLVVLLYTLWTLHGTKSKMKFNCSNIVVIVSQMITAAENSFHSQCSEMMVDPKNCDPNSGNETLKCYSREVYISCDASQITC